MGPMSMMRAMVVKRCLLFLWQIFFVVIVLVYTLLWIHTSTKP